MKTQYSTQNEVSTELDSLTVYRSRVRAIINAANFSEPESSMATWQDDLMRSKVNEIRSKLGTVKHVILVGIGGSSLGTEAVYSALKQTDGAKLHVLDTVSDYKIAELLSELKSTVAEDIAICVISKSGGTTETLANAAVLFDELGNLYGQVPYDRSVCVGNADNQLLKVGKQLGMETIDMQEIVGGRYSVFTAVGLVPLILLGFDVNELLDGLKAASREENETVAAIGAANLFRSMQDNHRVLNLFVFDNRLKELAAWYRQLSAESIGKSEDKKGNKVTIGLVPTISTPVELHSTGQLFFSGFAGVYTDMISVEDRPLMYYVPQASDLAPKVAGKSVQEIAYAIEGGVVGAYEARQLPFRHTTLSKLDEYDLGLFMGQRMLETMYLAELMNVDAFNQPNVELYKEKTREILDGKQDT